MISNWGRRSLCVVCLLLAAAEKPRWQTLNEAARAAVQASDYQKLREALRELSPLMPGNPRIAYNLAASDAKLGDPESALKRLKDLAKMGVVYDLNADDDFASIRKTPEFAAILTQMQENKKPVTHSTVAFTLSETDLIPEDIAHDPKSGRFFISSVRKSKIITADGRDFAKAEWSVLALAVDAKRRILWAATAWVPHCESCSAADKDKTALLAFDLDNGALKQKIPSPVKGLLGDMTISREGAIYVSEGINGAVFELPAGASELRRLDDPGEFPSPQNPALSADEKTLYVADYARGIGAIDLSSRKVTWLQPASDVVLSGIDGLYLDRRGFLAVQNGTNPPRIARFSADLKRQQILEANYPGLGEPTHGTFVDGSFYFLANTGWSDYGQDGKKKPGTPPVQSVVRKIDR